MNDSSEVLLNRPCDCHTKCECVKEVCANCGIEFWLTSYALMCDFIMKHRHVCSYECNKALGQVR